MLPQAEELLDFWFSDDVKAHWYRSSGEFDTQLRNRYSTLVQAARAGELTAWAETPREALALLIALDQLPRNIHRGGAEAFASDDQALAVARGAVDAGFDQQLEADGRIFFYLPFMHSEDLDDQQRCVELCEAMGNPENLKFARLHRDLIARFGRFPHRNRLLGRESSDEELAYLASDGAFRG